MRETIELPEMMDDTVEVQCNQFSEKGWTVSTVNAPLEKEFTVYVNELEFATICCTPTKLNYLIFGLLCSEGLITCTADVTMMRLRNNDSDVDVKLNKKELDMPTKSRSYDHINNILVSVMEQSIETDVSIAPEQVLTLMRRFHEKVDLKRFGGGVHAAALADKNDLIFVAEDIGRHNTLDKILGECILADLSPKDKLLLCTGRISMEMLRKIYKMQIPVVICQHFLTGNSAILAHKLGITLVGRVREHSLSVYSRPERIGCSIN